MKGSREYFLSNQTFQPPHTNYTTPRQAPDIYTAVPEEFVYDAASRECGALYYLGTVGYSQPWSNPDCQRKQVRSFASSLNKGRPSNIVGL